MSDCPRCSGVLTVKLIKRPSTSEGMDWSRVSETISGRDGLLFAEFDPDTHIFAPKEGNTFISVDCLAKIGTCCRDQA